MTTHPPDPDQAAARDDTARRPRPFRIDRAQPTCPGSFGCPDTRSAQILDYAVVLNGLCELERIDRAALRLIYWQGRTQAQVAAELHLPLSTVRGAVARGMRRLADVLTDAAPVSE